MESFGKTKFCDTLIGEAIASDTGAIGATVIPSSAETAKASFIRRRGVFDRDSRNRMLPIISIAVFLLVWEGIFRLGLVKPLFISSPSGVIRTLMDLAQSGLLWRDIAASLAEFSLGFLSAIVFGVICGILLGWNDTIRAIFSPFVDFFNAVPRIALTPIIILWFGVGLLTKTAVIFLGAFFPIVISTMAGVRSADPSLIQCARSFGATESQILRTVVLPASTPFMVAGMRMAVGRALVGMVVAEFIVSDEGVGHMILMAGSSFQTDKLFAGVVLIASFGLLLTGFFAQLERRIDAWRLHR